MRFLQQVFFAIVRIFPVLSYCTIPGFFNLSIDSVGTKHPKNHNPKRGQRLKPTTRAKAKGQSRMVPPGGFLRGEQFERERVVPPLSRLLCLLSCRSKKVWPRWQALAESRLENRLKGNNWGTITTSKHYHIPKPQLYRPLALSDTPPPQKNRTPFGVLFLFSRQCGGCGLPER